jgi:hypothetical protein
LSHSPFLNKACPAAAAHTGNLGLESILQLMNRLPVDDHFLLMLFPAVIGEL